MTYDMIFSMTYESTNIQMQLFNLVVKSTRIFSTIYKTVLPFTNSKISNSLSCDKLNFLFLVRKPPKKDKARLTERWNLKKNQTKTKTPPPPNKIIIELCYNIQNSLVRKDKLACLM